MLHITKPFNANLLKVRIQNLLKLRQRLRLRFREQIEIKPEEITLSAKDATFLKNVLLIAEQHLNDPGFDSSMLAAEAGISRTGLYQKLKALTGQSVNLFIRSVRLKRATQILIEGELSVGEVADETGFSSQQYFTFCFKKEFGQSPLQYVQSFKK